MESSTHVFITKTHIGKRRLVEGGLTNLLKAFENNKIFTQGDNIKRRQFPNINSNAFAAAPTALTSTLSTDAGGKIINQALSPAPEIQATDAAYKAQDQHS